MYKFNKTRESVIGAFGAFRRTLIIYRDHKSSGNFFEIKNPERSFSFSLLNFFETWIFVFFFFFLRILSRMIYVAN
jgi:hypothetical protein